MEGLSDLNVLSPSDSCYSSPPVGIYADCQLAKRIRQSLLVPPIPHLTVSKHNLQPTTFYLNLIMKSAIKTIMGTQTDVWLCPFYTVGG